MFEWNAIQNAETIFRSRPQTANGTSGSSPCVRTVISVAVWTFNYCNLLLDSFKNIINCLDTSHLTPTVHIINGHSFIFDMNVCFFCIFLIQKVSNKEVWEYITTTFNCSLYCTRRQGNRKYDIKYVLAFGLIKSCSI